MQARRIGSAATVGTLLVMGLACARTDTRAGGTPTGPAPSGTVAAPSDRPSGDGPPNYADNNGWKRRHELSAAEQREGRALADRIRPALAKLRTARDFAPESTRQALLGLGVPDAAVQVTTMRPMVGETTPPPGAVYAVRFADAGCVVGAVRPDRLMLEVTGAAAEFGCLEPFSH
jgi:hypothetical protein